MCKSCKISRTTKIAIFVGVGILLLWGGSWWLISQNFHNYEERGTFGDMFGAINALFSGLAFGGLIITLLYQKDELELQRAELQETREEMARQRNEFEEQNKTLKRQRFENTFFNMLSLQQEIVSNLYYEYDKRVGNGIKTIQCKGRELFEYVYLYMSLTVKGIEQYGGLRNVLYHYDYTMFSQLDFISRFDHYFRHMYRIFKYIDSTDLIEDDERYEYTCILRSQLSSYELVMLFYNSLTANGRAKLKPLLEKYSVFNNLREDLLAKAEDKSLYAEKAFDRYAE